MNSLTMKPVLLADSRAGTRLCSGSLPSIFRPFSATKYEASLERVHKKYDVLQLTCVRRDSFAV